MRCSTLPVLLALLVIQPVMAQEDCSAIFRYGLYDLKSSSGSSDQASSFANWFCSHHSDEESIAEHYGASYADVVRKITANADREHTAQKIDDVCSSSQGMQSIQTAFQESSQTINRTMVEAYEKCLGKKGLHVWLETTSVPTRVNFVANFNSDSDVERFVRITKFSVNKGVSCEVPKSDDEIGGSTKRYVCERESKTIPISITVNATRDPLDGSGGQLSLPGMPEPMKCPSTCLAGCNNYGGMPVCTEKRCTINNKDYGQWPEGASGEVIECNLPRGRYYVKGTAGVGPRGMITVTPDWYATVKMELDDGSGDWRIGGDPGKRPVNADNADHGEIRFNAEGVATGDGPVRVRFTVVTVRLSANQTEDLGVNPINLAISSSTSAMEK